MRFFLRPLFLSVLSLGLGSCAHSQTAPASRSKLPLRTLIVAGGPTPDYNQYAIESNARYLENITSRSISQRILFADGKKTSRTISAIEDVPDAPQRAVFGWIFDTENDTQRESYRASTLKRLDGPATKKSVLQNVRKLASEIKSGEQGLLYFTGHGSPGTKPRVALFGAKTQEDFENTTYSLWNEDEISTKELAGALQSWPQKVPLVLVMVQCHAGGFANILFEGGDPKNPLWNRDFCGFFAATGDRQASGCTSEVDETDYQDFTTHFFAALSGKTRSGKMVWGADYDRNGAVSLLEAFAWTNLQDYSIDVPVCTSEAYLRSVFPQTEDDAWTKTPYSSLFALAAPWQKAMFNGLSKTLHLSGENRIAGAFKAHNALRNPSPNQASSQPNSQRQRDISRRFYTLETALLKRFPNLKSPQRSAAFARSKTAALKWLETRPDDVKALYGAYRMWQTEQEKDEARRAMLWRFVRVSRTLFLQKRLSQQGTAAQKAAFARLRTCESRNPLR